MNAPEHKSYGNMSFEECSALKDLKSNVNLVIREADKGSSVVVMDRQRYIEEGYRQLNDTSVYLRTCRCGGTVDLCMTSIMCQLSPWLLCTYTLLDTSVLTDFSDFV